MTKKFVTFSLFVFWAVTVAVLTAGLVFYDRNKQSSANASQNPVNNLAPGQSITLNAAEISKHNSTSDCWMLIGGKVYNVTIYLYYHPAGAGAMIPYCGQEATQAFQTKDSGRPHSPPAQSLLNDFFIGNLNQTITAQTLNNSNQNSQNNLPNTRLPRGEDDD